MGDASLLQSIHRSKPEHVRPASSGRFGALIAEWEDGTKAVVKTSAPRPDGKLLFRGIPLNSTPRREVAFCRLASVFGWSDLVPETVLFSLSGHEASAQLYVPSVHLRDLDDRLLSKSRSQWLEGLNGATSFVPAESWSRLVLLDVVAGSRDRHVNNVGVSKSGGVVAWDNAATFGKTFHLYRNALHKHLFPESFSFNSCWRQFSCLSKADLVSALDGLLLETEVEHAWIRYQYVVAYPYKMPWREFAKGFDPQYGFPARTELFRPEKNRAGALRDNLLYIGAVGT